MNQTAQYLNSLSEIEFRNFIAELPEVQEKIKGIYETEEWSKIRQLVPDYLLNSHYNGQSKALILWCNENLNAIDHMLVIKKLNLL